jgi:hypothetical protein
MSGGNWDPIELAGATTADIDRINEAIDPDGDPPARRRFTRRARSTAASA